jgi:hypothetical protein
LTATIVALSCYLVFYSEEKTNYKLPAFSKVAVESITTLDIEKNKVIVALKKKGEGSLAVRDIDDPFFTGHNGSG